MAVVIRLSRFGKTHSPYNRVVVQDKNRWRDGRFLEIIGTLNARLNPQVLKLKEDRVKHWVEQGAMPTKRVRDLIVKQMPGFMEAREKHQLSKIQAARKKRKARLKAGAKTSTKAKK